jgi:signal transduction histidine kinase
MALAAGDRVASPTQGVRKDLPIRRAMAHNAGVTWLRPTRRRSRREQLSGVLVLGGLALFVVLTYVVVVLGIGAVIGHTSSPDVGLSVLATAIIALAFEPVQSRLELASSRALHGGRPSPYEVLSRFSKTVAGSDTPSQLPVRMARLLADGTGAEWAQIWLAVNDRPFLAATWPPPTGTAETAENGDRGLVPDGQGKPGRRSHQVRQAGELLGVLALQERVGHPLTAGEERLFAGLADQAGLALRGARLRTELEQRYADLSARAGELRVSRQRLVDIQDAERKRLERDIHDGAQQHLVALAVNLRLAHTLADRSPERADALLAAQQTAAQDAIDTLVSLSRGIYPRLLGEDGVTAALRAATRNSPVPVELTAHDVGRYPPLVEATAYFFSLEAVQNAAKHAKAAAIRAELRTRPGSLLVAVEDDGVGFDPLAAPQGAGLANMRDRVESIGGTVTMRTASSGGTRIEAEIPTGNVPAPHTLHRSGS